MYVTGELGYTASCASVHLNTNMQLCGMDSVQRKRNCFLPYGEGAISLPLLLSCLPVHRAIGIGQQLEYLRGWRQWAKLSSHWLPPLLLFFAVFSSFLYHIPSFPFLTHPARRITIMFRHFLFFYSPMSPNKKILMTYST